MSQTSTRISAVSPSNRLGAYEPFSDSQIDQIQAHADRILDEVGVEFRGDDEALELFRSAGARVEGQR
ncbi:MAG: trimethylamine methyltransferase family protein, partial [Acidimicrobiia bacterium]|nr:trimethylamine methyltransferase family protein [Acidimicrobiia bacterium]